MTLYRLAVNFAVPIYFHLILGSHRFVSNGGGGGGWTHGSTVHLTTMFFPSMLKAMQGSSLY